MNKLILLMVVQSFVVCCAAHQLSLDPPDNRVRFSFTAPFAASVAIAGSFNQWDPERDRLRGPDKEGVWTITLPLPEGRHEYRFVVNGTEWALDPAAPSMDDGMAGKNSLVIVPLPKSAE